jgi:hypothetical protein
VPQLALKFACLHLHVSNRLLYRRHAVAEFGTAFAHVLAKATEVLQNKIGGFVCHVLSGDPSQAVRQAHTASAPEMISISSLVICAWRWRL